MLAGENTGCRRHRPPAAATARTDRTERVQRRHGGARLRRIGGHPLLRRGLQRRGGRGGVVGARDGPGIRRSGHLLSSPPQACRTAATAGMAASARKRRGRAARRARAAAAAQWDRTNGTSGGDPWCSDAVTTGDGSRSGPRCRAPRRGFGQDPVVAGGSVPGAALLVGRQVQHERLAVGDHRVHALLGQGEFRHVDGASVAVVNVRCPAPGSRCTWPHGRPVPHVHPPAESGSPPVWSRTIRRSCCPGRAREEDRPVLLDGPGRSSRPGPPRTARARGW